MHSKRYKKQTINLLNEAHKRWYYNKLFQDFIDLLCFLYTTFVVCSQLKCIYFCIFSCIKCPWCQIFSVWCRIKHFRQTRNGLSYVSTLYVPLEKDIFRCLLSSKLQLDLNLPRFLFYVNQGHIWLGHINLDF